jgi:hypothetical protein
VREREIGTAASLSQVFRLSLSLSRLQEEEARSVVEQTKLIKDTHVVAERDAGRRKREREEERARQAALF